MYSAAGVVCVCSLEAQNHERVPAGLKPARGVRTGPVLVRIHSLLPLLQAAAGWALQAAALQTSECRGRITPLQTRFFSRGIRGWFGEYLNEFYAVQDVNQLRTTCILQDITPGTYTIEVNPQGLSHTPDLVLAALLYWL